MPPASSLPIHQPVDDDYEIEFARWKGLLWARVVSPSTSVAKSSVASGDGDQVDLSAVSGDHITLNHVYRAAGTYVVSFPVTDPAGNTVTATVVVAVSEH